MGVNEELSNLLNAPNREDFWIPMEAEGSYHVDAPWPPVRETALPYDPTKRTAPPHCHFVDVSSPTTPSFSTVEQLYAFGDASLVGGSDAFGQNFLPEGPGLGAVPESSPLSEAPALRLDASLYGRVCTLPSPPYRHCASLPLYGDAEFDVTAPNGPPSGHESESTNSSLETTFQLTDNFIAQEKSGSLCGISNPSSTTVSRPMLSTPISPVLDFQLLEPSLFNHSVRPVKVECSNLPTMLVRSHHTLPQMTPPMLPKLSTSSASTLYLQPPQYLDSTWDVEQVGSVCGRSHSHVDNKRADRPVMHKSHSTPTISCISRNSTGCNLFCNASFSSINKRPKKPYIGKLTPEERQMKIMRYRQKRNLRKFDRGVTYQCRKTLADRRPRVRGRFARNNDIHAIFPEDKSSVPEESNQEISRQKSLDMIDEA